MQKYYLGSKNRKVEGYPAVKYGKDMKDGFNLNS